MLKSEAQTSLLTQQSPSTTCSVVGLISMSSCDPVAYNNDLVRHVFGNLSIDKTRLPSSGLSSMGIPSFVAEWLLDKIVPGSGSLTALEVEKSQYLCQKSISPQR